MYIGAEGKMRVCVIDDKKKQVSTFYMCIYLNRKKNTCVQCKRNVSTSVHFNKKKEDVDFRIVS